MVPATPTGRHRHLDTYSSHQITYEQHSLFFPHLFYLPDGEFETQVKGAGDAGAANEMAFG